MTFKNFGFLRTEIFFSGFFDGIQLCGRFGAAFSETPDFSINLLSRNRLLADNDRFFFE